MAWEVFRQNDFTGGENLKILPEFMQPNQLSFGLNMELRTDGVLQTRKGKTKVNPTSLGVGGIGSIFRFAKEDGTKYLVVEHEGSLYAVEWDGYSEITSFGTAVKTGLDTTTHLRGVVWRDNLILTNGVDAPFRFDGSACTDLLDTPPKSKIIKLYANRLWMVDAAYPNRIRFSNLETFDEWPQLNMIKVRDGDGDAIKALCPVSGGMIIAKTRSVYPLYGTHNDNIRIGESMIDGGGCAGFDGAIEGGEQCILFGHDNLYLAQIGKVEPFPETHTPLIESLGHENTAKVRGALQGDPRRAMFVFPQTAVGDTVLTIDGTSGAIFQWRNLNASCICPLNASGDDSSIVIGDASDGYIYRLDNEDSDDGVDIVSHMKFAYSDNGTRRDKRWRRFWPEIDVIGSGEYRLQYYYDVDFKHKLGYTLSTATAVEVMKWGDSKWNNAAWGPYKSAGDKWWLHHVRGERISFEVRCNKRIAFKGFQSLFKEVGSQ